MSERGFSAEQTFSGASATNGERNEQGAPVTTGRAAASPEKSDHAEKPQLPKVIFFGNGPLADFALAVLAPAVDVIFHARTKADLEQVTILKQQHPDAHGILASFGILIKSDLLELFEPEGILNLHPSLLPQYRGASPIETAILAGDTEFGYSIMKLVRAMDAGPIYHQAIVPDLPLDKTAIYQGLATAGAEWLLANLDNLQTPIAQDDAQATYTTKLDKSQSLLKPEQHSAAEILRQIIAYQGFPKPKYVFYDKTCIILKAHLVDTTRVLCDASVAAEMKNSPLMLKCADRNFVAIDLLQPEGKKPMDAISFLNGYAKNQKA